MRERVSLRKKPFVLGLNQTDGQNPNRLFCPAGGGSFQFFPFCLRRNTKPVFNPALYGQKRLITNL